MANEWGTFQVVAALVAFLLALIGIWSALMKPAQENNKEALKNAREAQKSAELNNKEIQKAINDLSIQVAGLNIHLTAILASSSNTVARLDKQKDQLFSHESRLTRAEAEHVEYDARLATNEDRLKQIEATVYTKSYTKEPGY